MHLVGCKDVFVEYPVHVISVTGCWLTMHISFSLRCAYKEKSFICLVT